MNQLDNLDEVLKALEIMTASYGYAWSPKRVTLSSVGLKKGLQRFIEDRTAIWLSAFIRRYLCNAAN